jgi:hypothetical protein
MDTSVSQLPINSEIISTKADHKAAAAASAPKGKVEVTKVI